MDGASSRPVQMSARKRVSSGRRRRDEISSLRQSVQRLEEHLHRLRLDRRRVSASTGGSCGDTATVSFASSADAFWETRAKSESLARSKAMDENRRLRQHVKQYHRVAKALEKALLRCVLREDEAQALRQFKLVHQLELDDVESSQLFCLLLSDLEPKYRQSDSILVQRGLADIAGMVSATEIQGLTYRGDHASNWFLEASSSQVMPFTASHVQGHFVSRRYVERERTVFVWGVRY
ncbi:hypothetical protein ATCC90586_008478 [Pythium insidiosum]|nr:hypothetical protein ATCC90586_008478 [Pythium insidiosum]